MPHRDAAYLVTVPVVVALLAMTGCGVTRNLKITEVSLTAVELYLDEPRNNRLDLAGQKLTYINSNQDRAEVELFGDLTGGGWLVIWEAPGYTGQPVSQDYLNFYNRYVKGIAVRQGFFAGPQADTFAYRVHGRGTRYIFPFFVFYDDVDDVVKFGGGSQGPVPRPDIGGTFHETQNLGANKTRDMGPGGRTISRKWAYDASGIAQTPIDTDDESDWERSGDSFGAPTPP